ncbi:MAG: hypothetical protein IJ598_06685 [Ruminococcus sp.]|nr:hypothetical protein [Ruminococcus sp.]
MKHSLPVKKMIAVLSAGVMLSAVLAGCGGASGGGSQLSAEKDYAKQKLSAFVSGKNAAVFAASDAAYSKANTAAMLYAADKSAEGVQKIVRNLALDSLTITDGSGVVVASYPEGDEGKNIKELEGKAIFNKVVKGVSDKLMNDPSATEGSDTYTILAGVRAGDEGGVVVVGYQDAGYADVTGSNIAQTCGLNTVVLEKDSVISTTVEGVEVGVNLDALGVKDEDLGKESFTMTAGDKKYTAMAVTNGDYVVITAAPA